MTYHRLSLSDSVSSSISKTIDAACEIIDRAIGSRNGTGKILVHCSAGISRSPMVVAAYLMKRKGMVLRAALRQIVCVRPQISPNAGFLRQLKEMEMELYGGSSLEVEDLPKREKDRLALFEEHKDQPTEQPTATSVATANETTSSKLPDHQERCEQVKADEQLLSFKLPRGFSDSLTILNALKPHSTAA